MLRFDVKTEGALPLLEAKSRMEKVLRAGLHQAGAAVLAEVKQRTPVDTGTLKASERLSVTVGRSEAKAVVSTGVVYAPPVETGTRPGKMPPPSALVPWVRRHPAPPSSAITKSGRPSRRKPPTVQQRAFVIARAIGKRGTRGAHMFERGFEDARPQVERILDTMGRILAQELGGS